MGDLIVQRHPIIADGIMRQPAVFLPGENLEQFLLRLVPDIDSMNVTVYVGVKPVPRQLWKCVRVKEGHHITVKAIVEKAVALIGALVVLSIFTYGAAAGAAASAGAAAGGGISGAGFALGASMTAAMGATMAGIAVAGIQVLGALILNKVLGPKSSSSTGSTSSSASVYSIGSASNSARQYEPFGLLFGEVMVTPDVVSAPYSTYNGNDQYVQMILTPGINAGSYEPLYLGDTLLSSFDGVEVWQAGFSQMEDQTIPLQTDAGTITGTTLDANVAFTRTLAQACVRVQIDLSYVLVDFNKKGNRITNQEDILVQYRVTGQTAWATQGTHTIKNNSPDTVRTSIIFDLPEAIYDIQVTRLGHNSTGNNATASISLAEIVSYGNDTATYAGLARIGLRMKASGQLSGTPDQVKGVMRASPIPLWNGTEWVTVSTRETGLSNAAANILQYLRGYRDADGNLVAGVGLSDDMIDIEGFKAWILDCTTYDLTYDAWLVEDRTHQDQLAAMGVCGFGEVDFSPGVATPIWALPNQGASAVVNMATIKKASFQVDYTLMQTADGIAYSYYDRETWTTKTLYLDMPGVTSAQNRATVSGEGVTTEAQAAMLARYSMGQMLYQAKNIDFDTDMEYMTYGRMSLIQLQHDLTQWGYGGRVMGASQDASGKVTLRLDDSVPGTFQGETQPYIGLRIPGELIYRVLKVDAFDGTANTITLTDPWPSDATFPGSDANVPVYDTIWCYDFKTSPGQLARVISMSPGDGDFSTASVVVVPESPELWDYVLNGTYTPPGNNSLLQTNPIASALQATEYRNQQGDTTYTMVQATWNITGYADYCLVTFGLNGQGLTQVANVNGLSASWRVDSDGQYVIVVTPYRNGVPGTPTSLLLDVSASSVPPPNPDDFTITDMDGGIRHYGWTYVDTTPATDMAGVQIRYIAGTVDQPVWDNMTVLGDDNGFHTVPFDQNAPVAGTYTFALRAINTSGVLATAQVILQKTLGDNASEAYVASVAKTNDISTQLDQTAAQAQQALTDSQTNAAAIEKTANDLAAETQNRAQAISDEATARATAIANEALARQNKDDDLQSQVTANTASTGDNAAAIKTEQQERTDGQSALSQRIDSIVAQQGLSVSFLIRSSGSSATGMPEGWADGVFDAAGDVLSTPTRGWTLLQIASDGSIGSAVTYDTWADVSNVADLVSALSAMTVNTPFILYTFDEPQTNVATDTDFAAAVAANGGNSSTIAAIQDRSTYILVSAAGVGEGNGVERYRGSVFNDPTAWQQYLAQLVGGQWAGIEGNHFTQAMVSTEQTARVAGDTANAQQISALSSRVDDNAASVTQSINTLTTEQSATAEQVTALNAQVGDQQTSISGLESASQNAATSLNVLTARSAVAPNMLTNPTFANGMTSWDSTYSGVYTQNDITDGFGNMAKADVTGAGYIAQTLDAVAGAAYCASADWATYGPATDTINISNFATIQFLDGSGNVLSSTNSANLVYGGHDFDPTNQKRFDTYCTATAPAGTVSMKVLFQWYQTADSTNINGIGLRQCKVERGSTPTPYTDDQLAGTVAQASASITSLNLVTADLATSQQTMQASIDSNSSQIQQTEQVQADHTSQLNALTSEVDGNSSSISSLNSTQQGQAQSIQSLQNRTVNRPNLLSNPSFVGGTDWSFNGIEPFWDQSNGWGWMAKSVSAPVGTSTMSAYQNVSVDNADNRQFCASADFLFFADGGTAYATIYFHDADGNTISYADSAVQISPSVDFDVSGTRRYTRGYVVATAPAGTRYVAVNFQCWNVTSANGPAFGVRMPKLEQGDSPSAYTDDLSSVQAVATANSLQASWQVNVSMRSDGKAVLAGLQVGVDANSGTVTSEVIVTADKFVVVPGTSINDDPVPLMTLDSDLGLVVANERVGNLQSTATGNGQPIWEINKDGRMIIRDTNGVIRVRLGKLTD